MSTTSDHVPTDRLEQMEQHLEAMAERKWNPLREQNGNEPMEVWTNEGGVHIGHVNPLWSDLLVTDVIRTFDSGHYEFRPTTASNGIVSVRPRSMSDLYEAAEKSDVRRAAVIEALIKTGIHVPCVVKDRNGARLKQFETREEAERVASTLEESIDTAYADMASGGVDHLEIREFGEPRNWLAPDPTYAIFVRYQS